MKHLMKSFVWTVIVATGLSVSPVSAQKTDLIYYGFQLEEFEHRRGDAGEKLLVWNGDAFIGTDELKLRWLSQGEYDTKGSKLESVENRLVLQAPVTDFFDVKAGIRADTPKGKSRLYGVLGLTGLAKQWIEVDADLFVSDKGDASARLDAEYEMLLTNQITLTPSIDLDVAFFRRPKNGDWQRAQQRRSGPSSELRHSRSSNIALSRRSVGTEVWKNRRLRPRRGRRH